MEKSHKMQQKNILYKATLLILDIPQGVVDTQFQVRITIRLQNTTFFHFFSISRLYYVLVCRCCWDNFLFCTAEKKQPGQNKWLELLHFQFLVLKESTKYNAHQCKQRWWVSSTPFGIHFRLPVQFQNSGSSLFIICN